MRQGHLTVLFLMLYIICFVLLLYTQSQYDEVQREKQKVELALTEAVKAAGRELAAVINDTEEKKKSSFETAFLEAFYVSMGVFNCKEEQEYLQMHLPMLALAEADGIFFYYMEERQENGVTVLERVWSDKIPYGTCRYGTKEEEKELVAETLEKCSSEILFRHNYIASQYGISYSFFVPDFLQNTSTALEFPMLFVVFQGWPLNISGDVFYENCIDAGVYLQRIERYLLTRGECLSQPFSLYHKEDCSCITEEEKNSDAAYITEEEAVSVYGAFPCENCF